MRTADIIAALDKEIAQLKQVRGLLSGHETGIGRIKTRVGGETGNGSVTRKRVLSPEARKRIADAQKKRWAKAKKAAK
jgi:hypothetical protein